MSGSLPPLVTSYTILTNTGLVNNETPSTTYVAGLIGMVSAVNSVTFVNMTSANYDTFPGNPDGNSATSLAAMAELTTFFLSYPRAPSNFDIIDISGTYTAGTVYSQGSIINSAPITLSGPGNFYFLSNSNINIDNNIILYGGATPENVYFIADDTITIGAGLDVNGCFISNNPMSVGNGTTVTQGGLFSIVGHVELTNNQVNPAIVCYAKGTKILTNRGYVAIENLTKNDVVATRGTIHKEDTVYGPSDFKQIVWLGSYTMGAQTTKSMPVCIKAGALGDSSPIEDLYVSPSHGIIVDGRLVLARELLNGEMIVQDYAEPTVTYYHLQLDKHSAIVANGVIAESYLDFGDRRLFKTKWFKAI
jgi:hypothetical protein